MERTNGFLRTLIGRAISVSSLLFILLLAGSAPAVGQTICAQDQTVADFSQGTTGSNTVVTMADGDGTVLLTPVLNEDFTGTTLPAGWFSANFPTGGLITYAGGQVSVDGAHLWIPVSLSPGATIEFAATFTPGNFQNVGFSTDAGFSITPFIAIGRGNNNPVDNLYGRIGASEYLLGSTLIGTKHIFHIRRNPTSCEFFVDGVAYAGNPVAVTTNSNLYIQISDYYGGGAVLTVDWIRLVPYYDADPATYTSRIFDATQLTQWEEAIWNADVPTGTSLDISVRSGNTATPDGTWTSFIPVPASGTNLGIESRYIQYQAVFATSNNIFTPVLEDIAFNCNGEPTTPSVTDQPDDQTICEYTNVTFESQATGFPPPTVQWEVSTDGTNWLPIDGATSSQLTFTVLEADNGNQYRAVWTTSPTTTATSDPATLTVNPAPEGVLTAVQSSVVVGEDFDLVFTSTSTGPFTLEINEVEYSNIESGIPFSAGTASEIPAPVTFWPESQEVTSENIITDNDITELGLRVQSTVPGTISTVRIYKVGSIAPTFTVSIWDRANLTEPLATATYVCDATEGWKVISFPEPIAIDANTEYVVSYFSDISYYYAYTATGGFPWSSGSLSSPGVCFRDPITPRGDWTNHTANYWIDIEFNSLIGFNLTSITGSNGCSLLGDPINAALINIIPGNLWTGGAVSDPDWSNNLNWSIGIAPGASETAVIPEVTTHYPVITGNVTIDNLTVRPSAGLIVNSGGTLTVNGDLTTTGANFEINSTSTTSSGSLIVNGTSTGNVTYKRKMPLDRYRYISLPVSSTSFPTGSFWRWDEINGRWGEDQYEALTTVSASGIGYTVAATDNTLSFTGTVLTDPVSITATAPYDDIDIYTQDRATWGGGGWNLLGNPYPSALRGYNNDGITNNDFITHNLASFDPNYQAIYIYNGIDYYYIAASTPGYSSSLGQFSGTDVQAGQGFFVLARYTNVPFEFTPAMRTHNTTAEMMKSAPTPWPGLQLKVKYGEMETATLVVYKEGMSTGLDAGYDVGHLSSGAELEVYTILAGAGNDFNFARQALPEEVASTTAVPVGLDFPAGGEVTFSAFTIPLEGSRFWLEDKVAGTYTDLNTKSYTVTLPANTLGTGRFYIIASANTPTDIEHPGTGKDGLRIWNSGGRVIIQGEVGSGSLCEIYSMSGSRIAETRFDGGEMNSISVPAGTSGLLIVKVTDGPKVVTRKIAIPKN